MPARRLWQQIGNTHLEHNLNLQVEVVDGGSHVLDGRGPLLELCVRARGVVPRGARLVVVWAQLHGFVIQRQRRLVLFVSKARIAALHGLARARWLLCWWGRGCLLLGARRACRGCYALSMSDSSCPAVLTMPLS